MLSDFQRYWHGDQGEPEFRLDWQEPGQARRHRLAAIGAVLWHVAVIVFLLNAPSGPPPTLSGPNIELRNATPLIAPRLDPDEFKLTQKAPQTNKPAQEVDLSSLLPKPALNVAPERPSTGSAPPGTPAPPKPTNSTARVPPPPDLPQQGTLQASNNVPVPPQPQPPPPPLPPAQKKNPFESVTANQGMPKGERVGVPRIQIPDTSVDAAVRAVIRGAGGKGLTVGDSGSGSGGVSEALVQHGSPATQHSALELMSDPQGVDFKPYLIQVLAAVRRSWFAVLPESAHFARSGQVVIQFAVDRNGEVAKLVLASTSGADALDRAAVSGISGAVPFPPPPAGYHGEQVRLQLVFSYNMPR